MSENQTSGLFTRLGIVIIVILQVAKTPPTRSDYPPKHRGISSRCAAHSALARPTAKLAPRRR